MSELQKKWFAEYSEGVSHTVNSHAYENLIDLFRSGVAEYGSYPAFTFMDKTLTFSEIDKKSDHFAAYLQSLGLVKGDKIILQMPNILQFPIALFGALKSGLVVINTNPLYTSREMEHQYKDSEAKAVVILANFANNLESILPNVPLKHIIVTELGDSLEGLKGRIVNFVVKYIKKMVPKYKLPNSVSFRDAMHIGSGLDVKAVHINNEDTAFIQYTGGTTGISKGAELSHGNIIANVEGISEWFHPLIHFDGKRTVLGALPFYHIFALTVNIMTGIKLGFHNIVIVNPRDQKALIKELLKYPLFIFPGLNTLFNALINNPEFKKVDFSNLKITIAGGMALQKSVADRWENITGNRITEGYGLSETSPVLSCNPIDGRQQIGTIGIPLPSTDMKILREDGTWAGIDEPGEICANGPQVMKGYYRRPEETEDAFIIFEGKRYFKTGDIGIELESGFFKIVDRKKDMILVSGFNVFPNEIEEVISSHPGVLEVACVGVPDEKSTEAVKIFVVKKDPNLTAAEIDAYAAQNLTSYKKPKYIEFRDELPKTNVGKILRRALK